MRVEEVGRIRVSATQTGEDNKNVNERIIVSVRLRPLNSKEIESNDFDDWECINSSNIFFKNCLGERSMYPNAYTFDRVFGLDCSTRQVYEEAAKDVALSVLYGINSSVFAYGQTSSGKTYTMGGITQHAIHDIYDYVEQRNEREFVLKFSAMEIYNEHVRDLLSLDTTPLRLLDDPERGTVVERLTEEIITDKNRLLELIAVCETQRQVGETSLNETSSRSHQIIKLTIESSSRQFGGGNSSILAASVNFIDLAGSERTSQTLSTGSRLKEGSHINKSLLTLGKVIRALSKGKNGHVPYRDSKLTRILHNSLGGNARTAIICTMSPAHSHLEQSRNTLHFASCAKEVTTNAQVNVVMSDKALVKHLKKELVRLENELKNMLLISSKGDMTSTLKEKERQIEMMDKEIKELSRQRDLAQSRVKELLQPTTENQLPHQLNNNNSLLSRSISREKISPLDNFSVMSDGTDYQRLDMDLATAETILLENVDDSFLINGCSPKFVSPPSPDNLLPSHGWEVMTTSSGRPEYDDFDDNCKKTESSQHSEAEYEALVRRIKALQSTINCLVNRNVKKHPSTLGLALDSGLGLRRSKSCKAAIATEPSFSNGLENKNMVVRLIPSSISAFIMSEMEEVDGKCSDVSDSLNVNSSVTTNDDVKTEVYTQMGHQVNIGEPMDSRISGESAFEIETRDCMSEGAPSTTQTPINWHQEFEIYMFKIIQLWHDCHVPLVHRTYFFLLFKGDLSDKLYIEVELRRLSFINQRFSQEQKIVMDTQVFTHASSMKALTQEREMLTRQMYKVIPYDEREALFQKWGIDINSKQRRIQLSRRVWTDPKDKLHIKDSAEIVAKLVGFLDDGQVPKEMFVSPSFTPKTFNRRSYSWRSSASSLA